MIFKYGNDPYSALAYEETFCNNSKQIGVAVLGDSISAHFHIPEEWMGKLFKNKI